MAGAASLEQKTSCLDEQCLHSDSSCHAVAADVEVDKASVLVKMAYSG